MGKRNRGEPDLRVRREKWKNPHKKSNRGRPRGGGGGGGPRAARGGRGRGRGRGRPRKQVSEEQFAKRTRIEQLLVEKHTLRWT